MPEENLLHQVVLWKHLVYTSIGMFVLTILLIFISPFWAAIMSFAILSLWSRIPAMMTRFTKDFDINDFFSVLIAINVGGFFGASFGIVILWFSRIFSSLEPFEATFEDTVAFLVWIPFMPFVYGLWGGNPVFTLYTFTLLRHTTHVIVAFMLEPNELGHEVVGSIVGVPIGMATNAILANLFADDVSNLTKEGLQLSWTILFFIAAIFILIGFTRVLQKWTEKREKKKEEYGHLIFEK